MIKIVDNTPEDLITRLRNAKPDDPELVYLCRTAAHRIENLKRSLIQWKSDAVTLRLKYEGK